MKTHTRTSSAAFTGICSAVLCTVVLATGLSFAEISEPDHIIYGTPTYFGAPLDTGVVSLSLAGDGVTIASYTIGSDPNLSGLYALRVPMDSVEPRRAGTARSLDRANIFIGTELAATVLIGEQGTAQYLDIDPEEATATPAMSIGDVSVVEGDDGTVTATFSISLSDTSEDSITVDWLSDDGTAVGGAACTAGIDYLSDSGMATINPGDWSTELSITVCSETVQEADEVFYVNLLNPANAVLLDPQGKGTVVDDDTPPQLSLNYVTVTEPETGSVLASFRVSLSKLWDQEVSFSYLSSDGTAEAGLDYLAVSGTGQIPVGSLQTTIDVEVLADNLDEEDETFLVTLSAPVNSSILDGEGQGTIVDAAQLLVYVEVEVDGVAGVDGLAGAYATAVSPDGAHLYAAGRNEDAVVRFDRDPVTGALSFAGFTERPDFEHAQSAEFTGLDGPEAVVVSADGAHVYVAAYNDSAVAVFSCNTDSGDPDYGALTLLEVEQDGVNDLSDPGGTVDGLAGATALFLSPDDRFLYVAGSADSAIAVFERDTDSAGATFGRISFTEVEKDGVDDPSDLGGLVDGLHLASGVVVSPDGANVYASGLGDNAVAVFARDLTPPVNPTLYSTTHTASVWSAGAVIGMEWLGANDGGGSGVIGYSFVFDTTSGTEPDQVIDLAHGVDPHATSSAALADGDSHYFHLRTCDHAGVCSAAIEAGPFWIDLTPPDPATGIVSTSHAIGVSSYNPVIDMTWTGAIDPGAVASGVDGYSYVFNHSATGSCNQEIDLATAVTAVSSGNLSAGTWYFHICTADVAGNWGTTATAGPYEILDTAIPPKVVNLSSVSSLADASLDDGDLVDVSITQVVVTFSKSMNDPAGDSDPNDVTNPANYLLVRAGGNSLLETTSCAALVGDDQRVLFDSVVYDDATFTGYAWITGSTALGMGAYGLILCGSTSLEDSNGNLLDGNGDGTGGDDYVIGFQVHRANRLLNPNLDDGLILWSLSSATEIVAGGDAGGVPTSGSALIQRVVGADRDFSISQCVDLGLTGAPYTITGRVMIEETGGGDPGAADAFGTLRFYDLAGCDGGQVGVEEITNVVSDDTGGTWQDLAATVATAPVGAESVLVSLTVQIDIAEDFPFNTWFDSLQLQSSDDMPPSAPAVISISHTVGVESNNPIITMAWEGATDNYGGTGLAGYSYLFDSVADTVPDTVLEQTHSSGVHTTSSATLPPGTYYFHHSTCDQAGNCVTVHTGPYILVPDAPPAVVNVLTIATTDGYFLKNGQRTSEPITQVAVLFTEEVSNVGGGTQTGDVANPSSYLLVEAGADATFDTLACGPAQDDDQPITIDAVGYYSPPAAGILVNSGTSLPAGSYRLFVCAVIEDLSGNQLDGNADGTGGDDFVIDFHVYTSNLLLNPNFDAGLGGWSTEVVPPSILDYSLIDADDAPISGSASITNQSTADTGFELSQCVDVSGYTDRFDYQGWVRLVAQATGIPKAHARVDFYGTTDCTGTPVATQSSPALAALPSGSWLRVGELGISLPPGAVSAKVVFVVKLTSFPTDAFEANFDILTFSHPTTLIFADEFESGDTSAWAGSQSR